MSAGFLRTGLGDAGAHALLRLFLGPPAGGGDSEAPTIPGSLSVSTITATSAVGSWTASTDNVGVTGYEYRLNAGVIIDIGNVLTLPMTGLIPATAYTLEVRAYDLAGNRSSFSSTSFSTLDSGASNVPPPERIITLMPSARRNLVS